MLFVPFIYQRSNSQMSQRWSPSYFSLCPTSATTRWHKSSPQLYEELLLPFLYLLKMFSLIWVLFCVRLDMLHLRGPGQGEQSSHWSLYDLQQTWLQTGLPCHMVRCAHMTQALKDKERDCSYTSSLRKPLRRAGLSMKSNLNELIRPAPTGKQGTSLQSYKSPSWYYKTDI